MRYIGNHVWDENEGHSSVFCSHSYLRIKVELRYTPYNSITWIISHIIFFLNISSSFPSWFIYFFLLYKLIVIRSFFLFLNFVFSPKQIDIQSAKFRAQHNVVRSHVRLLRIMQAKMKVRQHKFLVRNSSWRSKMGLWHFDDCVLLWIIRTFHYFKIKNSFVPDGKFRKFSLVPLTTQI